MMKGKRLYILSILFLFICIANNKAEVLPMEEILDRDTVEAEIIKEIPIGRFDRGIFNYLFIPKGSMMFGTTFSWMQFNSEDSELLSILKDFNANAYIFNVAPHFSYFFRDNMSVGVRMSYGRTYGQLDHLHIEFEDDLDIDIKDVLYRQHMFTGTGFIRSYIGLTKNKRFGLFNETNMSFSGGDAKYITGEDVELKDTRTQIRQFNIGIKPGVTVFIMNNVCVEASFGVAGFRYRKETQITNGEENGTMRYSGANFNINILDINLSISICI